MDILEALSSHYEADLPDGEDDLLSVLVRSILSQATNTKNRNMAFSSLLDTFNGDWNALRLAPTIDIENAIKVGGLAEQKSKRIQNILVAIFETFGECSLEQIKSNTPSKNFAYLCSFEGVGPQSAALSLMLGAGADICPVNTDVLRVLKRVDLLKKESGKAAHKIVNTRFPEGRLKETHYALISHGRDRCLSRSPRCGGCPIKTFCSFELS